MITLVLLISLFCTRDGNGQEKGEYVILLLVTIFDILLYKVLFFLQSQNVIYICINFKEDICFHTYMRLL